MSTYQIYRIREEFARLKQLHSSVMRYELGIPVPVEFPAIRTIEAAVSLLSDQRSENDVYVMDVLRAYIISKDTNSKERLRGKLAVLEQRLPNLAPQIQGVYRQFGLDDHSSPFVHPNLLTPMTTGTLPPLPYPSKSFIDNLKKHGLQAQEESPSSAPPYVAEDAHEKALATLHQTVVAQAAEIAALRELVESMQARLATAGL